MSSETSRVTIPLDGPSASNIGLFPASGSIVPSPAVPPSGAVTPSPPSGAVTPSPPSGAVAQMDLPISPPTTVYSPPPPPPVSGPVDTTAMIVAIYNMLMTQPRVDSSSGANGISGAAKAPATTDPIAKIQKTVSSIDKKVTALTSNLSELTNSVSEVTNSLSELTTTTQHISETVDILKAISDGNPSNQGDGNPSNQGYGNSTNQGNVDIVDPTAQGGGRRRTRRNRA